MKKEFELISHSKLEHLNVLMVRMRERAVHIHRELELGLVLEGSVKLSAEQRQDELAAGQLYLVNPMEPHEFFAPEGALILAIQLSPRLGETFCPGISGIRFDLKCALNGHVAAKTVKTLCLLLAREYFRRGANYAMRCFALSALLLQQLTDTLGWNVLSEDDSGTERQKEERLFAITDYMEQNFRRKLLLSEIARKEGLSMSYLSHFFKDSMGVTFQQYLNQLRFEHACRLMEKTDRSILDISLESGFSDVRYFNRMFLAHYGCPPGALRTLPENTASRRAPISASIESICTDDEALRLLTAPESDYFPDDSITGLSMLFPY